MNIVDTKDTLLVNGFPVPKVIIPEQDSEKTLIGYALPGRRITSSRAVAIDAGKRLAQLSPVALEPFQWTGVV